MGCLALRATQYSRLKWLPFPTPPEESTVNFISFLAFPPVKVLFRVLENSESCREHCSGPEAQSSQDTRADTSDVSPRFGDHLDPASRLTNPPNSSECSMRSDASDEGTRHLALVFFDILLLDSRPLTSLPYHQRRKIMESTVLPIPGISIIAERSPIDLNKGINAASTQLKSVFAQAMADHQEGLVLKADEGAYIKSPWVKVHT